MRLATIVISASIAALSGSLAWADGPMSGTVTTIDRTTGVIMIQQTPDGTVGAASGGASDKFTMKQLPENLHAGDKVTVSYTESSGTKSITKLDKQ